MLIYLSLFLCTHNLSLGDCNLVVAVPPDSEDISPCELFHSISYGLIHFYRASINELFATLEDRTCIYVLHCMYMVIYLFSDTYSARKWVAAISECLLDSQNSTALPTSMLEFEV